MQVGTRDAEPGRVVLAPVGEIDMAGVRQLERALDAVLDRPGVVEVVVDLAEVAFLDSSGVATLLRAAAEAVGRGATLRVTNPRPVVARVLRITAVDILLGLPGGDADGTSTVEPGWRRLR
ncbi:anti-sigma B factor antagonist [Micromonospora rhizosphaerae]|uniref:Anti-sigma factor antagonist n=1 Tax=Micromonospora rhizosphaerae TaxID=568872 RepID=A0A1C6RUN2_9ACTN|nr:STAS domain-containing protein [Micromonospora rhizosphaerae]SCL20917.1 anti-sigma B factor antagonist [Micromonospora rhizosphaerae]